MVGVLQGAELAFEEDALAGADRVVQELVRVRRVGADEFRQFRQFRLHGGRFERGFAVDADEERVLAVAEEFDALFHLVEVEEFADLEADFGILVRVKRRDTTARGAERRLAETDFLGDIW